MHIQLRCLITSIVLIQARFTIIQASRSLQAHPLFTHRKSSSMASSLPDLPSITRLSPSIVRITGGNPSKFTLQGTNTYLVGTGAKRILIDTGEGKPVWADRLRQVLRDENASIGTVLLTHWHHDHVGGVAQVRELEPSVEVRKHVSPSGQGDSAWGSIADEEVITCEGASLKAVFSPGHTDDHVGFVLQGDGALFAGDNVLGHGTAVFENLAEYMASLKKMAGVVDGRLYPAHGDWVEDGKAKVREYIEHRQQREKEAIEVLSRARDDGEQGWGSMELVKVIYSAYPEALHLPAEGSLKHVLRKLQGEGKVKEERGRWLLAKREEGKL
jgi:ribonuclease/clavin/mitogillin